MDIREKVRLQYQALLTGDVALAVATTAPDWANDEAEGEPPACRIPGPAGLLATGAWMRAAFSDLRFVEHVCLADEHHVLSEITLSGRHTGPFTVFEDGRLAQVLPPTGRAFAVRQFHLHRLRGRRDRGPLGGARRPRHAHPDRRVPAGSTAAGAHAGLADHRPGGAGGSGGDHPSRGRGRGGATRTGPIGSFAVTSAGSEAGVVAFELDARAADDLA